MLKDDYYAHNSKDGMDVPQLPQFHTLGISSSTAEDIRRQVPTDLQSRLNVRYRWKLPTLSILSIGHSDARLTADTSEVKTSLSDFRDSIMGIAERCTSGPSDEKRRILLSADGLHPDIKGQHWIHDQVRDTFYDII